LAPLPTPFPLSRVHTGRLRKRHTLLTVEVGKRGWWRNQIIRQRESLVFYKSFNNLWLDVLRKVPKLSKKVLVCVFQLMKLRIGEGMLRVEV
jgi:hypothetical protein